MAVHFAIALVLDLHLFYLLAFFGQSTDIPQSFLLG